MQWEAKLRIGMVQIDGNGEAVELPVEDFDADCHTAEVFKREVPANCRNSRYFMLYGNRARPDLDQIARFACAA